MVPVGAFYALTNCALSLYLGEPVYKEVMEWQTEPLVCVAKSIGFIVSTIISYISMSVLSQKLKGDKL